MEEQGRTIAAFVCLCAWLSKICKNRMLKKKSVLHTYILLLAAAAAAAAPMLCQCVMFQCGERYALTN